MGDSGLIQRLRSKVSARRAESKVRAHKRRDVAAQREAEKARERKHSGPPNIGGGVG
jgi:hypothetical protein